MKDVLMKKRLAFDKSHYLFLTGGVGTDKKFTIKVLFQEIIWIYETKLESDPYKPKGIIVASTRKVAFNASGITTHSIF